jgi:hypothetical protein
MNQQTDRLTQDQKIRTLESELNLTLKALIKAQSEKLEYKKALEKIAAIDYRPLKSPESLMAKMALEQREF